MQSYLADEPVEAGRPKAALALHQDTITRMTEHRGPDHPHTLAVACDLAASYSQAGRHAGAIDLHTRTLARRRALFGGDHTDTHDSLFGLAEVYPAARPMPTRGTPNT